MDKKIFKQYIIEIKDVNENEKTLTAYASTSHKDRDGEVVPPTAIQLENFNKNPVILWAHNYKELPIGRALWTKKDDIGLMFKMQFAEHNLAMEVFKLYKQKILNSFSIGFIPRSRNEDDPKTYSKIELLEISAVPVPANPNAVQTAVDNGLVLSKALHDLLITEKSVIPFKHYPLAPEGERWDASAEIRKAEVKDLKVMATWFDKENPDVKGSYKLPHHKADGYKTVWRAVAAAMAALLGARGGVRIPSSDRKGVYNHLAKHYKEFDKKAPEFKEYTDEELNNMFLEEKKELKDYLHEDIQEYIDTGKCTSNLCSYLSAYNGQTFDSNTSWIFLSSGTMDNDSTIHFDWKELKDGKVEHIREQSIKIWELEKEIAELKAGRVLSEKNRTLIKNTMKTLETLTKQLDELLKATDKPKDEPKQFDNYVINITDPKRKDVLEISADVVKGIGNIVSGEIRKTLGKE